MQNGIEGLHLLSAFCSWARVFRSILESQQRSNTCKENDFSLFLPPLNYIHLLKTIQARKVSSQICPISRCSRLGKVAGSCPFRSHKELIKKQKIYPKYLAEKRRHRLGSFAIRFRSLEGADAASSLPPGTGGGGNLRGGGGGTCSARL